MLKLNGTSFEPKPVFCRKPKTNSHIMAVFRWTPRKESVTAWDRHFSFWHPAGNQFRVPFRIKNKAGAHLPGCWILLLGRLKA